MTPFVLLKRTKGFFVVRKETKHTEGVFGFTRTYTKQICELQGSDHSLRRGPLAGRFLTRLAESGRDL